MKKFFSKLTAFFMSILAFFGLVKPVQPDIHHMERMSVSDKGIFYEHCIDEGCAEMRAAKIELPFSQNLSGTFDCSDDCRIFIYKNADYSSYVSGMKDIGCKTISTYNLGANKYTLMKHKGFTAYISYLNGENMIRVYIGMADDSVPDEKLPVDEDRYTPSLWQLNIDNEAAQANGGMGYVIQTTDGKFIVIDGGYRTRSDGERLYKLLSDNKPEEQSKPVIAGWFITHSHVDHYGTLRVFSEDYADKVEVEGFYYNLPYFKTGDITPEICSHLEDAMNSWKNAVKYRKLHTGMSFGFSGVKATVLCTFEDIYPFDFTDGNDTSSVFKFTVAGQDIIFLGDAEYGINNRLAYLDSAVLKADILQYAHHGYDKQCTEKLYSKIAPSVVLWPMSVVNYETETRTELFAPRYENNPENVWIRTNDDIKKIILKDEGPVKIELPYTPSGERITDYKALYNKLISE